jgi:glycine cleavage system H protein
LLRSASPITRSRRWAISSTSSCGEVLEINPALEADPALVNREPFGGGWFYKLKLGDDAEKTNLMSGADYDKLIAEA